MKKLMHLYNHSNSYNPYTSSSISRLLSHFTRTLTSSSSSSSVNSIDKTSLFSRLSPIGNPSISIIPLLDQWVDEGNPIDHKELHKLIRQLRKFKRYNHALQISEWMSDKSYIDSSLTDISLRLNLISKVHGLKQAEEYFDKIPDTSKVWQIYGSLLSIYAEAKSVKKAEAIMQKLRELNYARPLSYNVMLGLYSKMGNHKKINPLIQEMEEKSIHLNKYTYSIRLNAYSASSNMEQMEKLLTKMEDDPKFTMEWNYYAVAANGYLKSGDKEKAVEMLKKAEQNIRGDKIMFGYEFLLTLYASLGKKSEVYRVWDLHKKIGKFYNRSYLCVMSSLAKLDDLDGVEKIFQEWDAGKKYFDYQIPHLLITSYCKKGFMEKAETVVNKLVESGNEPNSSTWSRMALGYLKKEQMDKVIEALKKAILASQPGWKPNIYALTSCLDYLEKNGDVETTKEIKRLLQEKSHFSVTSIDSKQETT